MKLAKCFNFDKCHNTVDIQDQDTSWGGLVTIKPKLDQAIWICRPCADKPKLFKAARQLMFKKLGWEASGRSHITTDEL